MNLSSTSITKNTIYNLLGFGVPMLVAFIIIPMLIKGLGIERFGVLNLAWVVIGYFSFFDFGIGKSLTKLVAEKIGQSDSYQIPGFFWTSFFLMLGISLLLAVVLAFFVPSIVNSINISKELQSESLNTFYILVFSIPIVATTAGLRGVLEAYQKFGIINIIRIFLGIFTFLVPLACLVFTKSLFWIVLFLVLIRIVIWFVYLNLCFNVNNDIKKNLRIETALIHPVFKFSIWITLANFIGPLINNIDRFLIGIIISAEAVAYYATPYEVVARLLLIPSALVAVLFPIFSASFFHDPDISKKLFYKGIKYIFIILYPIVFLIVAFSFQGLNLWLGLKFAKEGSVIFQILAIGILLNGISYIPFNFFQGVGKPNIPAILNLIELPFYLILMWFSIKKWGINGAAYVWILRIIIDTAIIFYIANIKFDIKFESRNSIYSFLLALVCLIIPLLFNNIYFNIFYSIIYLPIFIIIVWKYFISSEEKSFFFTKIKWKTA